MISLAYPILLLPPFPWSTGEIVLRVLSHLVTMAPVIAVDFCYNKIPALLVFLFLRKNNDN